MRKLLVAVTLRTRVDLGGARQHGKRRLCCVHICRVNCDRRPDSGCRKVLHLTGVAASAPSLSAATRGARVNGRRTAVALRLLLLRHGRRGGLVWCSRRIRLARRRLILIVAHHLNEVCVILRYRVGSLSHQESTRVDTGLGRLLVAGLSHLTLRLLMRLRVLQGAVLLGLLGYLLALLAGSLLRVAPSLQRLRRLVLQLQVLVGRRRRRCVRKRGLVGALSALLLRRHLPCLAAAGLAVTRRVALVPIVQLIFLACRLVRRGHHGRHDWLTVLLGADLQLGLHLGRFPRHLRLERVHQVLHEVVALRAVLEAATRDSRLLYRPVQLPVVRQLRLLRGRRIDREHVLLVVCALMAHLPLLSRLRREHIIKVASVEPEAKSQLVARQVLGREHCDVGRGATASGAE